MSNTNLSERSAAQDDLNAKDAAPNMSGLVRPHTRRFDSFLATTKDAGVLVSSRDGGGRRHFLLDKPVHAGAGLDLLMPSGKWLPVRYESRFEPFRARFFMGIGPAMKDNEGKLHVVHDAELTVPADAIFRWRDTNWSGERSAAQKADVLDVHAQRRYA